jgi:CBS domain-containing protein
MRSSRREHRRLLHLRHAIHFPQFIPGANMRHVITVSPEESVNRVMNLMTRRRVRQMPVLREGELAGIISIGDVVKHRLDDLELETNVRDAYIAAR